MVVPEGWPDLLVPAIGIRLDHPTQCGHTALLGGCWHCQTADEPNAASEISEPDKGGVDEILKARLFSGILV